MFDKKTLSKILNSIVDGRSKKAVELYKVVKDLTFKERKSQDILFFIHYYFNLLLEGMAKVEYGTDNGDVLFLLKHYNEIERTLSNLFREEEGLACCTDKARYIYKWLLHYFVEGKELDLGTDDFYIPEKILNTKEKIVDWYNKFKERR